MAKKIDIAGEYMDRSFALGFNTAIECIEKDIKNTSILYKREILTSLTKKLRKALAMHKNTLHPMDRPNKIGKVKDLLEEGE